MAISRRTFLAATIGTGLGGLAAGCTGGSAATPSRSPTGSATVSTPASTADLDWSALARQLRGRLVRPGERGYRGARRLFNPRFDATRPLGIVYCRGAPDVQATVGFARDGQLPLALRSGGHSYGGWSTGSGVVLDVGDMRTVSMSDDNTTASVGAGARLIDVYAGLAAAGRAVAAGSCPTVGIAGLTLGGGVGVLSRAWGLTCDQLTGIDVVTADGRLRTADADNEPDLFWACRGGGGGQLGVVTDLRFRTHAARPVSIFYLRWPWSDAATVLSRWLEWSDRTPARLWSTCKLLTVPGDTTPRVFVGGSWLGSPGALEGHLGTLVEAVGRAPAARTATTYAYLSAMLREAGCADRSAAQCSTPRTAYDSASNVLLAPLSDVAVDVAVQSVEHRQRMRSHHEDGVSFDALGGAVRDTPPAATAFPYRDASAIVQYNVNWTAADAASAVAAGQTWLHTFRRHMTDEVGDHAYVNYADPGLDDFGTAYYGDNRSRLARIRAHYDPDDLFRFAQSVRA